VEYFGPWLRQQLKRRDWKQKDLADRAGVSTGAVSEWVNGHRRPEPPSCDRIADALGLPWDVVLAKAGHRERVEQTPDQELRGELKGVIDRLSVVQLETVRPMLLGLYRESRRDRLREGDDGAEAEGA